MMESLQTVRHRLQAGTEIAITGLGDSLTQGWMVQKGFYDRFIDGLRQQFSKTNILSHNIGVPGSTAQEAIDRLYQLDDQLPDVVIVQFGLNDCSIGIPVEHYSRHLETIVTNLKDQSILAVLVTSCPVEDAILGRRVQAYYDAIAQLGNRLTLPVIRLDEYWLNHAEQFSEQALFQWDGVHPTDAGHQLMAEGLLTAFVGDK